MLQVDPTELTAAPKPSSQSTLRYVTPSSVTLNRIAVTPTTDRMIFSHFI